MKSLVQSFDSLPGESHLAYSALLAPEGNRKVARSEGGTVVCPIGRRPNESLPSGQKKEGAAKQIRFEPKTSRRDYRMRACLLVTPYYYLGNSKASRPGCGIGTLVDSIGYFLG